jgi:fucose permease
MLTAILVTFIYGMISSMLGTVMPAFSLTIVEKSGIAVAQALGLMGASLSAGPLIDSRGTKPTMIGGLIVLSLALYTLPSMAGYRQILTCFAVLGLGGGVVVTAANAVASGFDPKRRASALNFLNLFFGLGLMAAPFLAAHLLNGDALRLCYLEAVLASGALLALIVTPIPPPAGPRGLRRSDVLKVLRRPVLWLFALLLFLYVACEVGVSNWFTSYLISRGIPKSTALNILSLGFATGLLSGRLVVSAVLLKVSAPLVNLAASIGMTIATFLMLQTTNPALAAIAVFCAGFSMGPVFPTALAMIGDAFPVLTGTAMGVAITSGWIGLAASAPLIAFLAGSGSENLGTALLIFPAASAVMILVSLLVRPLLRTGSARFGPA